MGMGNARRLHDDEADITLIGVEDYQEVSKPSPSCDVTLHISDLDQQCFVENSKLARLGKMNL
jgi:hypothetical protein